MGAVVEWLRQLPIIEALPSNSTEVVFHEPVGPLQREKVHVLSKRDYKGLRRKVKDPRKLQHANSMQGVKEKMLVKLHNGWLLGNGLAFNSTHRFYLGVLNERDCIENRDLEKHGRNNCAREDWVIKSLLKFVDP